MARAWNFLRRDEGEIALFIAKKQAANEKKSYKRSEKKMNRNFESMIADLIYNEIQGGLNCLIGNVREILNNSSIFNQNGYEDIKQKIKSEVSYLYDDIAQKMDDNRSSMTDLNSQLGRQIIRNQCESVIQPVADNIKELKENIRKMEESLAKELKNTEVKRRFPKQIFKYKVSDKIYENIMSLEYVKKMGIGFVPKNDHYFALQRKN